jgi:hypothetical protein
LLFRIYREALSRLCSLGFLNPISKPPTPPITIGVARVTGFVRLDDRRAFCIAWSVEDKRVSFAGRCFVSVSAFITPYYPRHRLNDSNFVKVAKLVFVLFARRWMEVDTFPSRSAISGQICYQLITVTSR